MEKLEEYKILKNYFGGSSTKENNEEIKAKLSMLSWKLFQQLELYQERFVFLKELKKDPVIKQYLKFRNCRSTILGQVVTAETEQEKEFLVNQGKLYTLKINKLRKNECSLAKIKEYNHHEEMLAFISTILEEEIGKQFEQLRDYYRSIYVTDIVQHTKNGLVLSSHNIFTRKKLKLYTCDLSEQSIDLSNLFYVREYRENKPILRGKMYFSLEEDTSFAVIPELWLNQELTAFSNDEGDLAVKKYLYPNR